MASGKKRGPSVAQVGIEAGDPTGEAMKERARAAVAAATGAPPEAAPAPVTTAEVGKSLEKPLGESLGVSIPSGLGTDFPSETPREFPRAFPSPGGWGAAGRRNREDNVLGRKLHPRQESSQFNPTTRQFIADGVRLYADSIGTNVGAATDFLLEMALRYADQDSAQAIAKAYAKRCEELRVANDWKV